MKPDWLVIAHPEPAEHDPYYSRYTSLVEGDDLLAALEAQLAGTVALLAPLSEEDGELSYAAGKWTIKQVLGHVLDTERIFAYRALRISRNDATPIEGFEQDDYVRYGPFGHCRLADVIEEFSHVRQANVAMLLALDTAAWHRRGIANQVGISVRALAYIMAGHELHHRRIIEEKYLPLIRRR